MKTCKFNLTLFFLIITTSCLFVSCNSHNDEYLQEYSDFKEFNKIDNPRLTGWFPVELIKSDAYNIKNVSYLSTKCVFAVFDYTNEKYYDSIFNEEKHIDNTHNEIFKSQIKSVKNIIPEWFPKIEYWDEEQNEIILFDNCYAYKDSKKKQIYYFHPEEETTYIDGKIYPGIRNTVR